MGGSQKYIGVGLQAGGSVVVYLLLGLLADRLLDTFPWFMLVGILLASQACLLCSFARANELNDSGKKPKARE